MTTTAINYKRTYFEEPNLTQIQGQPSYETLSQLIRELKANVQCVHTNLGGGNFLGHLGLVLSDAQYALVSTATFVWPVHPGPLVIAAGTTCPMSTVLKEQHKEALRSFHEVHNVEKSLKQQIVAALEPQYLKAIWNRTTQTITRTIPETIEFLMEQYGNIAPKDYIERESQVKSMIYDIDTPIDRKILLNLQNFQQDWQPRSHKECTSESHQGAASPSNTLPLRGISSTQTTEMKSKSSSKITESLQSHSLKIRK